MDKFTLKILKGSLLVRTRRAFWIFLSLAVGSQLSASFLSLSFEMKGKIANELKQFGANIAISPKNEAGTFLKRQAYLFEEDLIKIKTIFWKHNIVAFSPYLYGVADIAFKGKKEKAVLTGTWFREKARTPEGKTFSTGTHDLSAGWHVQGRWFGEKGKKDVLLGRSLARRLGASIGDVVTLVHKAQPHRMNVSGIISTGGMEDEALFVHLKQAQTILGLQKKISMVLVSAVTVPLDAFGRTKPESLSKKEYEKWFCTAYVTSIARQLQDIFKNAAAKPLWQVAEAEGAIFTKINVLMQLLVAFILITSSFCVAANIFCSTMDRQTEVAMMKSMGADTTQILYLFSLEVLFLSAGGGIAGFLMGRFTIDALSRAIFGSPLEVSMKTLCFITLFMSLAIGFLGMVFPALKAIRTEPGALLKEV